MKQERELATWLLGHRREIEQALHARLGAAAPRAAGPEAETLRRFRTFVSTSLMRGEPTAPALDGLRPDERRVMALLTSWTHCAAELAGPHQDPIRRALTPLLEHFRLSLRGTRARRQASGQPRAIRRAVSAAIDRVADAFLAVDVHDGHIVDANPAAGALLGVERNALLGLEAISFVPEADRDPFCHHLDSLAEGEESLRFDARFEDTHGNPMQLEASVTRFCPRGRTLALLLLRPARSGSDRQAERTRALSASEPGEAPGAIASVAPPNLSSS